MRLQIGAGENPCRPPSPLRAPPYDVQTSRHTGLSTVYQSAPDVCIQIATPKPRHEHLHSNSTSDPTPCPRTYPFLKPRLGIRRCIGVCPPSNRGPLPPLRALDPLCPLPHVLPVPDPFPLPTRFLSLVDPGFGERLLSRRGSVAAATAP